MFAQRHMQIVDFVKWFVLVTLAAAISLLLAGRASGQLLDTQLTGKPKSLPESVSDQATPIARFSRLQLEDVRQLYDLEASRITKQRSATVRDVWRVLSLQQNGYAEEAIAAWKKLRLLPEVEAWRHIAMGAAYVQLSDVQLAFNELSVARELEPDNAVVHYYMGLVRLIQAEKAMQWPDALGPTDTWLVCMPAHEVAPNTKSMYRLMAKNEMLSAIEKSPYLNADTPLMGLHLVAHASWNAVDGGNLVVPATIPLVSDLLHSLHVECFVGDAHHALGGLALIDGNLERAEQFLDEAAELGSDVAATYSELGREYQVEEKYEAAFRAYGKAMSKEKQFVKPALEMLNSLGKALRGE